MYSKLIGNEAKEIFMHVFRVEGQTLCLVCGWFHKKSAECLKQKVLEKGDNVSDYRQTLKGWWRSITQGC